MYRTRADVDEHINSELNRLISKFESTESDVRKIKNILNNYAKNTKQDEKIEDKLDSVIRKCNSSQDYIRSNKR